MLNLMTTDCGKRTRPTGNVIQQSTTTTTATIDRWNHFIIPVILAW